MCCLYRQGRIEKYAGNPAYVIGTAVDYTIPEEVRGCPYPNEILLYRLTSCVKTMEYGPP
jgi:hypothetical protein